MENLKGKLAFPVSFKSIPIKRFANPFELQIVVFDNSGLVHKLRND